jgi:hypothetical protein
MQNAKQEMQSSKWNRPDPLSPILHFALHVLHFAFFPSSWRAWRLGGTVS